MIIGSEANQSSGFKTSDRRRRQSSDINYFAARPLFPVDVSGRWAAASPQDGGRSDRVGDSYANETLLLTLIILLFCGRCPSATAVVAGSSLALCKCLVIGREMIPTFQRVDV